MNAAMHPGSDLAEALARQVERWAAAAGAAGADVRAARDAAQALALAMAEGHVCLDIAQAADAQALLASGIAGRADGPGQPPLVLDDEGRLYLRRYFDYERRLARRLLRTLPAPGLRARPPDIATLRRTLDARFAAEGGQGGQGGPDWQKLAAALALRGRLAVVSGGPGTGKTTTVVALLACLLALDPACRIALAAPTGKAAARLAEAIAQQAAQLPPALRAALPREASTVHRLLEAGPAGFGRHAGRRLALDVLIVDEASMLDLALATRLLEAVPDEARIVLLGDKDQLAAVESGAVFAELCADPSLTDACRDELAALTGIAAEAIAAEAPRGSGTLPDSTIWLQRSYRFAPDSAIARLAAAIRSGNAEAALAAAGERLADADAALDHALRGFAPLLAEVRAGAPPAQLHAAFARYRVLAALRDGPRGVSALNARIEQRFRAALGPLDRMPRSPWYPGRPVLVRRNDALLKLFNGDVGIALPQPDGALEVVFPRADGSLLAVAPVRLPPHDTAFAMTVHQSQGSEFDDLLVLLPEQSTSRVLTRELVYTAVTRARRSVTLCAGDEVLGAAIGRATQRHSGLLARLREEALRR